MKDNCMLKKKIMESKIFCSFDLESFVPTDHFLRKVKEYISFDFIREKVKHLYRPHGSICAMY
jgi:transposase